MNKLIEELAKFNEEEKLRKNKNRISIEESKTLNNLCTLEEILQNIIQDIGNKDYLLLEDENFFLKKQQEMTKAMQEIVERINDFKEDFEIE